MQVQNSMAQRCILLAVDGPLRNVVKIKPPMCFSTADSDRLLQQLAQVQQFGQQCMPDDAACMQALCLTAQVGILGIAAIIAYS